MSDLPNVATAVIAAAGSATRMWPSSKVIPKELFPLGKVPTIARLVAELTEAGITRIIFVLSAQGQELIRRLFDGSVAPPEKMACDPVVQSFQASLSKVQYEFTLQSGPYGNAIPLVQSAELVGAEPCIYAFGDDIVLGENATEGLIRTYRQTGSPVLAAQEVPAARKTQFGILECRVENGIRYVSRMIEKPRPDETQSNLASFGRYLVTPELMRGLLRLRPGKDGEVWFADSIVERLKEGEPVCAVPLTSGTWYTVGDPAGYAAAVAAAYADDTAMAGRV